jgi:hypothetical protein
VSRFYRVWLQARARSGYGPARALLAASYQHSNAYLYTNPTEMFGARYATGIETLLPGSVATAPGALTPIFTMGFGAA